LTKSCARGAVRRIAARVRRFAGDREMRRDPAGGERSDLAYLVLSGAATASRCPEL
jgi:hypothetical protein